MVDAVVISADNAFASFAGPLGLSLAIESACLLTGAVAFRRSARGHICGAAPADEPEMGLP
jgi:hypothetical protein